MSYSDILKTAAHHAKQIESLHEVADAIVGHPSTKHYSGSFKPHDDEPHEHHDAEHEEEAGHSLSFFLVSASKPS